MNRFSTSVALSSMLAALALAAGPVHAQTSALTFTGGTAGTVTGQTFGWRFSVTSPITVVGLGFWDQGGDGLSEAHPVGIWTDTGTLLTSATVPSGTTGSLINGFRETSASTLLAPGTYRIGGFVSESNLDAAIFNGALVSAIPDITYLGRTFQLSPDSTDLAFAPGTNNTNPAGNFGPTFFVSSPVAAAAPEPGSIALLLTGALPVTGMILRRRKRV